MTKTDFIEACKTVGKDIDLVQAGGGNISVKLDLEEMIVKSSGTELKKVSKKNGHVKINFRKISGFIREQSQMRMRKEEPYARILKESVFGKTRTVPSMETGFHSVLGKTVIHTHPVAVNSVCCEKNSKKNWQKILFGKNFTWIPYKSPGIELSAAVYSQTIKNQNTENPQVILLENHGLIVSGNSLKECIAQTNRINDLAKNALKKNSVKVFLPSNIKIKIIGKEIKISGFEKFLKQEKNAPFIKKFVFPDAVIYTEKKVKVDKKGNFLINEKNPKKRKKVLEVLAASLCILMNISQYGKPKFLSKKNVLELKNMSLEKLRKRTD